MKPGINSVIFEVGVSLQGKAVARPLGQEPSNPLIGSHGLLNIRVLPYGVKPVYYSGSFSAPVQLQNIDKEITQ